MTMWKKKKPYRALREEEGEQKALFDWVDTQGAIKHLTFATMNEVKVKPWEGLILKSLGKRKGVLDVYVDKPAHGFHGLRIELKAKSRTTGRWGYPTPEQKAWVKCLNAEGYYAVCCRGAEDAIETIKNYLQGKYKHENKSSCTCACHSP